MFYAVQLLHIAAAIVWLGGMVFVLGALRPVAMAQLAPPLRLPFMAAVLRRFFLAVWTCIGLLLLSGGHLLAVTGMKNAPIGAHLMLGIGVLMCAIFGHLYFSPFRHMQAAVAAADWAEAGRRMAQIHPLVVLNSILGWLAVAAVYLLR
jgi:uncharacterized membrane protein